MNNKKEKTKQLIVDSYLQILKDYLPEDITVKHLCMKANINRSTFYEYFSYIEQLEQYIVSQQVSAICQSNLVENYNFSTLSIIPHDIVDNYIVKFVENQFINRVLHSQKANYFNELIIKEQIAITLQQMDDDEETYYNVYFQNVGATSIVLKWIRDGKKLPIEKLIDIIQQHSKVMYTK